jgi:probable HAF family extracellular repeat protein
MKSRSLAFIITALVLTRLAAPIRSDAQEHAHYKLIDLGTFGGPQSYVNFPGSYARILNNRGMLTGWADTAKADPYYPNFCFNPDCSVSRAFQWQNRVRTKLRGLATGLSSATAWISPDGLIAGWSENGQIDPLFPGFPVTHGVLWKNGEITDLGTLDGGFESVAMSVNSHGQVVGAADNTIPDATPLGGDNFGWTTETRAFLWQDGVMQDLHTLGGPDAVALLVNDNGQVVGDSYTNSEPSEYCANNVGFALTTGAFLWENGEMQNLGNFGGTCTFAFDLNNRGEVIGASTLSEDQAQHPFLWEHGQLKDLGTFGGTVGNALSLNDAGKVVGFAAYPGDQIYHAALWDDSGMTDLGTLDVNSFATDVNSHTQIVGFSTNAQLSNHQGFLWENGGPVVDLNSLVPPGSQLLLTDPANINDRGEIAGVGVDANGNQHAFLLIPCDNDDAGWQSAAGETSANSAAPTQHAAAANPVHRARKLTGLRTASSQQ